MSAVGGVPPRDGANLAPVGFSATRGGRDDEEGLAGLKARADIAEIVRRHDVELEPRGGELWGRCPFHEERTPSFKVDRGRQRFICFGCGRRGDALDFLAAVENLDAAGAVRRLRELVGAPGVVPRPPSRVPAVAVADPAAGLRRDLARAIWRRSEAITDGLPYRYLVERRGLGCWDPDRLRWHPECPWRGGTAGCLVAPINDHATGLVVGVWRILPVLGGEVRRRGLGPTRGNAARLFPAPGRQVVIAEGVEDAIAAHELTGLPAWAALSAGNMAGLVLPSRFLEVLILADADDTGRTNAHALATRLRAGGREAKVLRPAAGKDANDVLRAARTGR